MQYLYNSTIKNILEVSLLNSNLGWIVLNLLVEKDIVLNKKTSCIKSVKFHVKIHQESTTK